jgi:subtilisin family serine protease
MQSLRLLIVALALGAALPASEASQAQVLGLDLPSLPAGRLVDGPATLDARSLAEEVGARARRLRLQTLIRRNPDLIEADPTGAPVLKGQILAIAPTAEALRAAEAAGFRPRPALEADELDLGIMVIEPPAGLSTHQALMRLRRLDPAGRYDFNHLYDSAGPGGGALVGAGGAVSVGLIDTGFEARHPVFGGARIAQRGFAPGGVKAQPHGLATASLLVGREAPFAGSAAGASLYAADIYGSTPAGGSAQAIARALAWMAQSRVGVINMSIVGPPNLTLEAAVAAMQRRGHLIVAAVGNDGPAAAPLYPASYPGVVAVTAVDARGRVLPEAGRAIHVDFAAQGADLAAAGPAAFRSVRGTSFAAPIVAGLLARRLPYPDIARAHQALTALAQEAQDLGPRGRDATYGAGWVGRALTAAPDRR